MWQKTPEELRAVLSAPFSSSDIEWRVSATNAEKTKGLAVPYVTNRAIQNRLDDTVGIDGWYNDFRPWKNGSAQLCGISIFFPQLEQCLTKWDGADDSEFESVKGGLSDSMKRAAVEWSIGRYLYGMTQVWVTVQITNSGKKSNARIRDEERPRLDQAHDEWVAYLQAKERGENPPRPKAPPPLKAQKGQNGPPAQTQGQYQAPPQGAQQRQRQGQGRPPAQPTGQYQAPPQGAQQPPQQGQGRPPAQPQGQYQAPPQGAQQYPQQGQGRPPAQPQGQYQAPPQGAQQPPQQGQGRPPAQPQGQYQAPPQGAQQYPQQGQGRPPAQPQGQYQAPPQGTQQPPQQGQGRPPAQPQGQYQAPPQGAQQRPQQGQGRPPAQPQGQYQVPPQGAQQHPQQGQGRPPAQPQGQYQTPPQGAQQPPQQGQGSRPIPRGCLLVTGARLKNTINGGQRLSLQLADENNSVFQAYLRNLDTRIAPGVLLSDAQITTQNKGGVVLYILESYQIVGSPEENAA